MSTAKDALLEQYRGQYRDWLRWQGSGAPTRSNAFRDFDTSVSALLNAASLSTFLGGVSTSIGNDQECAREPALSFETQPNSTRTALQAAVFLLTRPPTESARYVCVVDSGLDPQAGLPYDVHNNSAPSADNHPSLTGTNLMSDVLRSALKLDNLYPAYAAHLFAMENRPGFATEQEMRHTLGSSFGQVYVHREMLCLQCHNSEFSRSGDPPSGWNRTLPILGNFERALYGAATGEPTADAFAMFRTDVLGGGTDPWGLTNCGTFKGTVPNDPLNIIAHFIDIQGQQFTIRGVQQKLKQGYDALATDGLNRLLPPEIQTECDFCAADCTGTSLDVASVANSAPNAAAVKALVTNTNWTNGKCIDCHNGSGTLYFTTGNDWANELIGVTASGNNSLKRVQPGDANNSYLVKRLEGSSGSIMPQGGPMLTSAQINQVKAWINGMPVLTACAGCTALNCSQPKRYVACHEAFAFLTATNAVNNIWSEAFGGKLTIANYFPRNDSQRDGLWNLTEYRFVPNHWSPKSVLERSLTSTLFNRKAPKYSTFSNAYVIPPLFDPWIVADPRVAPENQPSHDPTTDPENHRNAVGESVHRYSAQSLLYSIHKSIGWPAPQRFPASSGYPDADLHRAIGQYFSDESPGFQTVDLQGPLFWESVHGACVRPANVSEDWIDRLMTAVNTFDLASPGGPLKVEDLVTVMRDWLLGHGGIESTAPVDLSGSEAAAIAAYFGVAALSDVATSVASLQNKLRGYCGVLVETPQFMLAGITPAGLGPKPRLRVCNGAPCTYKEMCQALAPAINTQLGSDRILICGDDSVNVLPIPDFEPPYWIDWCFGPGCGLLEDWVPEGCYKSVGIGPVAELPSDPSGLTSTAFAQPAPAPGDQPMSRLPGEVCPTEPPLCDPRCARIDCCGGPLPPPNRRGRALALAWAEDAEVSDVAGAKILSHGGQKFETLERGRHLKFGDLIAVPAGSKFSIKTKMGELKTPKEGLPKDVPNGMLFMMVTGEQALKQRTGAAVMRTPPVDHITRVRNSSSFRRGEAGVPLTVEEFKDYKYPELEDRDRWLKENGIQLPQGEQPPAEKPLSSQEK